MTWFWDDGELVDSIQEAREKLDDADNLIYDKWKQSENCQVVDWNFTRDEIWGYLTEAEELIKKAKERLK